MVTPTAPPTYSGVDYQTPLPPRTTRTKHKPKQSATERWQYKSLPLDKKISCVPAVPVYFFPGILTVIVGAVWGANQSDESDNINDLAINIAALGTIALDGAAAMWTIGSYLSQKIEISPRGAEKLCQQIRQVKSIADFEKLKISTTTLLERGIISNGNQKAAAAALKLYHDNLQLISEKKKIYGIAIETNSQVRNEVRKYQSEMDKAEKTFAKVLRAIKRDLPHPLLTLNNV